MVRHTRTPTPSAPPGLPLSGSRDELRAELAKLARRDASLAQAIDRAQQAIKDASTERSDLTERSWWIQRALETLERVV
jgi:predicted  nucleic acid-binding Zn-ribbon protein